jgi:hypothetical protein
MGVEGARVVFSSSCFFVSVDVARRSMSMSMSVLTWVVEGTVEEDMVVRV